VLFAALIGGFALGMAAPNFQYFVNGCGAFARLEKVLQRQASCPYYLEAPHPSHPQRFPPSYLNDV